MILRRILGLECFSFHCFWLNHQAHPNWHGIRHGIRWNPVALRVWNLTASMMDCLKAFPFGDFALTPSPCTVYNYCIQLLAKPSSKSEVPYLIPSSILGVHAVCLGFSKKKYEQAHGPTEAVLFCARLSKFGGIGCSTIPECIIKNTWKWGLPDGKLSLDFRGIWLQGSTTIRHHFFSTQMDC